jgi:signal transduction histidine kinase
VAQRLHSLETLLGATTAAIWGFDTDGVCTICQGGGLATLGYSPSDFEGQNLLDRYPADSEQGSWLRRALAGESFVTDQEREPGVVVQTSYKPLRDEAGAIVGGIALSVDVTHRLAREAEGTVLAGISRDLADHARQSPQTLAEALAATVADLVGDTVMVVEVSDDAEISSTLAVASRYPELVAVSRAAVGLWRTALGWSVSEGLLVDGVPTYLDELTAELRGLMQERLPAELITQLDAGPLGIVPLRDRGTVTGAMVVQRRAGGAAFTSGERALLEDIGERAGLALANARLIQTAHQLMADRRALLGHLIDAEESERRRIAHDIHDDTIQVLAAVDLRLQLLRRKLSSRPGGDADTEVLDALRQSTQAATSRLRRLLFELQPPALESGGVGAALRQLADDLFAETGVTCTVVDEVGSQSDESAASVLFRIGKEALINARKHAQPDTVQVTLVNDEGGIRMCVRDDGVGLPADHTRPDNWPHLGLETMRDRARLAGGTWSIEGAPGRGTAVEVWIPLVRGGQR